MRASAVVMHEPKRLSVEELTLTSPTASDVVVEVDWSGVSAGTERLFWTGEMPPFPGMGYPLVPGYEAAGRVVEAGAEAGVPVGAFVFAPGARCFGDVRGLFGGAASRIVVAADRVHRVAPEIGVEATLLALAATARHALERASRDRAAAPSLIIGHGALGRLMARVAMAAGDPPPVVWERDASRRDGGDGYEVVDPDVDERRDYATIYDVSGDPDILDQLVARLAPGGEIVLAGFYRKPISFAFPPAFIREARLSIAAEWKPPDLAAVVQLIESGALSLSGLISHRAPAADAERAYRTAFEDPACLKMVLDWRGAA